MIIIQQLVLGICQCFTHVILFIYNLICDSL